MSKKKTLIIDVQTEGGQDAVNQLDNLEQSLKGVENESKKAGDSIEDVTKNGGAIAILDKLTGGMASSFRDAYEATKLFNFSLKGTRTALISTGIGAMVVSIGLIVAYWDDIVEFVSGANAEIEEQNNLLDINRGLLDDRLEYLGKQKEYNDEHNISNDKIIEKEKLILSTKAKRLQLEIDNLLIQYEKESSLARQQTFWEELTNSAPKVTEEEAKELADRESKILELKGVLRDTLDLYDELGTVVVSGTGKPKGNKTSTTKDEGSGDPVFEEVDDTYEFTVDEFNNSLELLQGYEDEKELIITNAEDQRLDNLLKNSLAEKKISEEKYNSMIWQAEMYGMSLQNLGAILGSETAEGKAVSAAGALVNTYLGITEVWAGKGSSPFVSATLAEKIAGTVVVATSGFAAVKNILSTQIPQRNGGGGSSSGGGGSYSVPSLPPQFNVVGTGSSNQLAQSLATESEKPVKAYVVSTEVTSQQEFDSLIEDSSNF